MVSGSKNKQAHVEICFIMILKKWSFCKWALEERDTYRLGKAA